MDKQPIEAWLDEIRPFGTVLEIGLTPPLPLKPFHLKEHIRIDLDWQRALPPLGTFDFILYNGSVIESTHVETGTLLLKEGKKTLQKVHEIMPELSTLLYRDQDLDAFREQMKEAQKPYLSRFLTELLENGQITESQYLRQIEKGGLKKSPRQKVAMQGGSLFECLLESLKHMVKGSRFSCLMGARSHYEDPRFFEEIITNPSLDYQERSVGGTNYMIIERL